MRTGEPARDPFVHPRHQYWVIVPDHLLGRRPALYLMRARMRRIQTMYGQKDPNFRLPSRNGRLSLLERVRSLDDASHRNGQARKNLRIGDRRRARHLWHLLLTTEDGLMNAPVSTATRGAFTMTNHAFRYSNRLSAFYSQHGSPKARTSSSHRQSVWRNLTCWLTQVCEPYRHPRSLQSLR